MSKKSVLAIVILLLGSIGCSLFTAEQLAPIKDNVNTTLTAQMPMVVPTSTDFLPTETNVPSSTPTNIPTTTFTPTVYVPVSGDIIFSTDFSDIAKWNTVRYNEGQAGYIAESKPEGLYIVVPEANDYIYLYYDLLPELSNVRIEADVELVGGTNFTYISFMCRSSNTGEYSFNLDTGGYWSIDKWRSPEAEWVELAYGGSIAINVAKAKNHVVIECNDNHLKFSINGKEVGNVTDNDFSKGSIGIGVDTFDYPHAEVIIYGFDVFVP
jgi:hypothetical protein